MTLKKITNYQLQVALQQRWASEALLWFVSKANSVKTKYFMAFSLSKNLLLNNWANMVLFITLLRRVCILSLSMFILHSYFIVMIYSYLVESLFFCAFRLLSKPHHLFFSSLSSSILFGIELYQGFLEMS